MKILVCPLNWGLGHATRCIPLIRQWINEGHEVVIATDGHPFALLHQHFPTLRKIKLRSYKIRYSNSQSQIGAMFLSLPSIISGIIRERFWLHQLLNKEHFDRIVSDNRFGMWNRKSETIYITHQIRVIMPKKIKWLEAPLAALHRFIINRYNQCLVPDYEGAVNLSGDLSHQPPIPHNVQYIGPLSRFNQFINNDILSDYQEVIVVSGPEPQRTLFEREMIKMALQSGLKTLLVRGLPGCDEANLIEHNLHIATHLPDSELASALICCSTIYCRSGYSSIMDLDALNCLHKAIFIPTPGQTEQEYLAEYLRKKSGSIAPAPVN